MPDPFFLKSLQQKRKDFFVFSSYLCSKYQNLKRMTKKTIILFVAALMGVATANAEKIVESPNGRLTVDLAVENGAPRYQVALDGQTFVESSALGLVTNIGDFSSNLTLKGVTVSDVKDEYTLRNIKQSHVSYEAREAVARFEQNGQPAIPSCRSVVVAARRSAVSSARRRPPSNCLPTLRRSSLRSRSR